MSRRASDKATRTALWATTMTKWSIRHLTGGKRGGARSAKAAKRWQFVAFAGPGGRESRGIVDLIAIRRDHRPVRRPLKPGDRFEIVLIQIKGGTASDPTGEDIKRLRAVKSYYRARAVVLASWVKGKEPSFRLLRARALPRASAWTTVSGGEIFGGRR